MTERPALPRLILLVAATTLAATLAGTLLREGSPAWGRAVAIWLACSAAAIVFERLAADAGARRKLAWVAFALATVVPFAVALMV